MMKQGTSKSSFGWILVKVILLILLIVAGVVFRPVMAAAFLFGVYVVLSCHDDVEISAVLFALLNVSMIYKLSPGSTSLYTYIELIAIAKYFYLGPYFDSDFLAPWLLYVIYLQVGCGTQFVSLIKVAIVPLILYYMARNLDYQNLKTLFFFYFVGVLASSLIGLCSESILHMNAYVLHKEVYLGNTDDGFISSQRFSGLWGDPNYYTIHLILSIAICAVLLCRREIKRSTFFVVYILMAAFGSMTGSKSFFLMLILVTGAFIMMLFRNGEYGQWMLFLLLAILLGALVLSGEIEAFDTVLSRLDSVASGKKDLTTGRADIWQKYLAVFLERPIKFLFGNGIKNGQTFTKAVHNAYIDFLDYLGLFGTSLFLMSIHSGLAHMRETSKKRGDFLPLLSLAMLYFFLNMFYANDTEFELLLAFGFLYYGGAETGRGENDSAKTMGQ